jgi:NAD-dependent deacetylase
MEQIVVLTGAGMSADSGIQTFRDAGGLWEGHDIHEVATPGAWKRDPEKVLDFYNERRQQAFDAKPNAGHLALASLEDDYDVAIITQNVDSLHERAGSSNVIHLHGNLSKARSVKDPSVIIEIGVNPIEIEDTARDGAQLRPHVVWFGEAVPNMEIAADLMPSADRLIVVGTSLAVYPAAGLVDLVQNDIPKYMVDPVQPDGLNSSGWRHIQKNAKDGVPKLVDELTDDNHVS